jgi:predicted nuclease of restriction endonuclease-like (RecB) superfamily
MGENSCGGLIMEDSQQNIIIYNTKDGKAAVSLYAKDGMVWMNQNQIAQLFDTAKQNIGQHISNILNEGELDEISVVKNYFTTAADGKEYNVAFYNLDMILAIGFRVRSKRGTQFRIWANRNLKEYMTKGFVMDDERLKNPDGRPDYFDELLERIRSAQYEALKKVNKDLVSLYWDIGRMIVERQEIEGWGKSVVKRLSADLRQEFSGVSGFSIQNRWYMHQFYSGFHDNERLQPLVGEIACAHNLVIMSKCKVIV